MLLFLHALLSGETPLTCAAYCGHYDAVKALLEAGGWSPFCSSCLLCLLSCCLFPVSRGGVRREWAARHEWHLHLHALANQHTHHLVFLLAGLAGETPLTCAAYCGHYDAVKALLEAGGADVNAARQDGTTPLNKAAYADAKVRTVKQTM